MLHAALQRRPYAMPIRRARARLPAIGPPREAMAVRADARQALPALGARRVERRRVDRMRITMTSAEEWTAAWFALGGRPGSPGVHRQLVAAHAEPHRAYHTLEHVEHCLRG